MMTRRNIQWLIGLMSIAALMLVGFQWYWIQNAYELRTEQFNLKATDALQDVVRKLEKQEAVYMMRQRQAIDYQQKQLQSLRHTKVTRNVRKSSFVQSDTFLRSSNDINPLKRYLTWNKKQTSDVVEKESFAKSKIKVLENARDLLFLQRPINERVSKQVLDSLLKKALVERGLDTTFEFSVSVGTQSDVFRTSGYQPTATNNQLFKATLFPNDIGSHVNVLSIYFPTRSNYLSRALSSTLLASGLLLLLMLGCFYVATTTILNQKKLADVKNDFINNMTHELKTPISTIALATQMAQDNTTLEDTKTKRFLNIIHLENQRLSSHVERVLQMAQIEKGNLVLKKTDLDMHDLVVSCLNGWEIQLGQVNANITLDLDAHDNIVYGDEVHLTNILNNLIDNALKYNLGNDIQIKIATKNAENRLLVAIKDNGIGLSTEQCERIFEQFYRVPTGNLHNAKGFGLGLSYVKKVVDMHNGSIQVESKLGHGSTFTIML